MKIIEVLQGIESYQILGNESLDVQKIANDSRMMTSEAMFIAIIGKEFNGHHFINHAINRGAIAIVLSEAIEKMVPGITYIVVKDTKIAQAIICENFYREIMDQMNLIGVTGTHGKTTTASYFYDILNQIKGPAGLIGSINHKAGYRVYPSLNTTPDILACYDIIAEVAKMRGQYVAMEVSATGLIQKRVEGLRFKVAVFTNLSYVEDTLYTLESYRQAKELIFNQAEKGLINLDDETGVYYFNRLDKAKRYSYAINQQADYMAKDVQITLDGTSFTVIHKNNEYSCQVRTPGIYSVYNSLATIGALHLLGHDIEKVITLLSRLNAISGRFDTVRSKKGYVAVIDFARTPDGLKYVYDTIDTVPHNNVISVFGCKGDKDKEKRDLMGKIAGERSDFVVITSDNPRDENPESILEEIEKGIVPTGTPYMKLVNRRLAIVKALEMGNEGDIILISGKGHENYQLYANGLKEPFDDKEEILNHLSKES